MTMEMLWSLSLLVLQISAQAAHSHKGPQGIQGLSCLNDFVKNVSCTWNRGPHQAAPGVDCWIIGVRKSWVLKGMKRKSELIRRSCKLSHHRSSPPGCSFAFEKEDFNQVEVMPNISLECEGGPVEILTNYKPLDHIKMHPPGFPSVNKTANHTQITWSPGSPLSLYIDEFDFNVQVTQKNQTRWEKAHNLYTREQGIKLESLLLKGACQVRVRVRSLEQQNSHWSNWSPTASWMEAPYVLESTHLDLFWVKIGVLFSAVLVPLLLCGACIISSRFRRHKGKSVPNPSKYFHTLHSVHKGNLKKWLNPQSASESFFVTEASDPISAVEVCEIWDVVPSTSPSSSSSSSTSALLHFQSYPSAGSDTSGIVDNFSSSSSSSCFYNMGYFMSASSSMSARTAPTPAYFTYKEDFQSHNLHISLCPSFTAPPTYEALKREPQSPDSGFGIDNEEEGEVDVNMEMGFNDPQSSSTLNPTMHLTSQICPPFSAPPPPHPHGLSSDCQQVDVPVPATGGSYAAWPVAGAVCRSSSMPVEPCKTGYLTLKELQTTFSNKSI